MGRMQMKDRNRQIKQEEQYTIHGPRGCIYIGAASIVFGIAMAAFCLYSRMRGNPTASIGIMLLFLILFSVPGIYLIAYGSWSLTVHPETVVIRRLFGMDRIVSLKDVTRVKWRISGCVFYGAEGKLFTVYEMLAECERLLWRLIQRGVEVIPPIGVYRIPDSAERRIVLRIYEKRVSVLNAVGMVFGLLLMLTVEWLESRSLITALGCISALSFLAAACRWQGRVILENRRIQIRGIVKKRQEYSVQEIGEVRLDMTSRSGTLVITILGRDGILICRITERAKTAGYRNHGVSFIKECRRNGIRITGYEKLDENLWRLISSGIIDQKEIPLFCSEECRRLDLECRKYSPKLSEKGVEMAHGMVMLTDGFAYVTGSENGGSSISFAPGEEEFLAEAAYVMCFLKNDRILYAKKDELLFYLQDVVKSVTVETPEGKKKIYLFEPVMYAVVKYVAQYCVRQMEKGEFDVSDQYLVVDLK